MTVTAEQIKAKKLEVAQRQVDAVKVQNASQIAVSNARAALSLAQGEFQELQAQKQLEDAEAAS